MKKILAAVAAASLLALGSVAVAPAADAKDTSWCPHC